MSINIGASITRPRFPATFAMLLDDATGDPHQTLNTYISSLTGSTESWSIGHQLEKAATQHATRDDVYADLLKLLKAFLTDDGVVARFMEDKIDWVAGGICLLVTKNGELFPRIAEVRDTDYIFC